MPRAQWSGERLAATGGVRQVRRAVRNLPFMIGLLLLVLIVGVTLFPRLVTSFDPIKVNIPERLQAPNLRHMFGTDQYGRDILARVAYGGRVSLVMGVVPIVLAAISGTLLGLLAGYYERWGDLLIMRVVDVWVAFPTILLAMAVVTVLGPGMVNIMIAVGIAWIPYYARMVRSSVLETRAQPYIEAARVLGIGGWRMMLAHILPNVVAPIIVMSSMGIGGAILTGASLSFLGLGPQSPTPEWGVILSDGRQFIRVAAWIGLFPGLAIAITVLAANLLGDGLRDLLDPRMRQ
ncbi:MAG: ABC transporter permease [Kouleothrix sp.]|nr:ABC transporter permease [Kouleothrix sp.]